MLSTSRPRRVTPVTGAEAIVPRPAGREPNRLPAGARVALVSPSGPLRGQSDVDRAIGNAAAMGWDATVGRHALLREAYFAGNDALRLTDMLWALEDPAIDGIWCLRGGYGASRLLPDIPIDVVSSAAKPLIGYSDITALHALWSRAGLVSYHGPTARATIPPDTHRALFEATNGIGQPTDVMAGATVLVPGTATGRLTGGNLALAASLVGTPWAIDFAGAIAVFEDVNEASYRVDRMLVQLLLAGALDACMGIVFGQFTACSPDSDDGSRAVAEVLRECAVALGVPAAMGAPFGHVDEQWTLPLGAHATLHAGDDSAAPRLTFHRSLQDTRTP